MNIKEILADPRRRVIFTTIVSAAILLILVLALIINIATGKKHSVAGESADVAIATPVDVVETTPEVAPDANDKNVPPVDNSNDAGIVTILPTETATDKADKADKKPAAAEDLPKTGPESALPLAILAGSVVAFMSSRVKPAKAELEA